MNIKLSYLLSFAFLMTGMFLTSQAQKGLKGNQISNLRAEVKGSASLSSQFKALTLKATQNADDDCTPPPCTGIIDPWTCECFPDLKDPWEDDQLKMKMNAVKRFEGAISKGEGKSLLTKAHYATALKRYPGNSLKAMVGRMNYYGSVVK